MKLWKKIEKKVLENSLKGHDFVMTEGPVNKYITDDDSICEWQCRGCGWYVYGPKSRKDEHKIAFMIGRRPLPDCRLSVIEDVMLD